MNVSKLLVLSAVIVSPLVIKKLVLDKKMAGRHAEGRGQKGHSGGSHLTTNHEEIKSWVEKRGGCPAVVSRTHKGGGGVLRVDYPGYSGKRSLEPISWKEFFKIFDKRKLALLYQDKTKGGRPSRFSKLVSRH